MAYLVWILTGIAIVLGFLLGLLLGKTHDYRKKSVGTLLVGYTGEDDDGAHILIGAGTVLVGITYLTVTAFQKGAKAYESAVFNALVDAGVMDGQDAEAILNSKFK